MCLEHSYRTVGEQKNQISLKYSPQECSGKYLQRDKAERWFGGKVGELLSAVMTLTVFSNHNIELHPFPLLITMCKDWLHVLWPESLALRTLNKAAGTNYLLSLICIWCAFELVILVYSEKTSQSLGRLLLHNAGNWILN